MTNYIPEGYSSLTPYLIVKDADKAIEYYKKAFGAKETSCMRSPDTNKVMHAELEVYGSKFMLSAEWPEMKCYGPQYYKGTPVSLHLYVKDCDAVVHDTIKAGATVLKPMEDQFWGDRMGTVQDPFGHQWSIATHKKDMTPAQMAEAGKKWMEGMKKKTAAAA